MTILLNSQPIESFVFSGGECHVKLQSLAVGKVQRVSAQLRHSDDIMMLLLTIDAIRRMLPAARIHLDIPYFPYARQDRVCNPGEALSVRVMADLINSLHCEQVTVVDPHSDVTPALINHCRVKTSADIILDSALTQLIQQKNLHLVSPDAGAEKKVRSLLGGLLAQGVDTDLVCATKVRDSKTGSILATNVDTKASSQGYLIVDDICDGGGTFIELAKALKNQKAGELYLYVSHGIFSKGLDVFKKYFTGIYCFQSYLTEQQYDPNYLTILEEVHHEN